MYNVAQLKAAFASLVGIEQANIPGVPQISAPLTDSLSGVYVQSKHPLVSLENIWYAAPDFNPNNWASWVSNQQYLKGVVTNYAGALYQALNNVTSATIPPNDAVNWVLFNPFQSWLQRKYNQAITNLFAKVVEVKKLSNMAKAIQERMELFYGGGNRNSPIVSDGSLVGFQITPQSAEGLLVIIDQIGIQLSEAQVGDDGLTYYLYNSEEKAFLGSWKKDVANPYTFSWAQLQDTGTPPTYNAVMQYLKHNTSGSYFIAYYQSDLKGNAINKEFDCSKPPCFGCDGNQTELFNRWSKYVTMRSIKVPASALQTDRSLFDVSQITYDIPSNWGLNLQLTVRCDLTDLIIYTKLLYADVFAMQLAKEFLETIAMSSRINPTNNQIQVQARAQLDAKFPGSWILQYNDSIQALNIDLSGFSKACLPCDNSKKLKWKVLK